MAERYKECGTRRKFQWVHPAKRKSELTTPTKCKDCEPDQMNYCIEKSFAESGKDPKTLKITNVMINVNPEADKKAEKVAAKAEQKIAELSEEVDEAKEEIEEDEEETE
jgi:hypothetical protein